MVPIQKRVHALEASEAVKRACIVLLNPIQYPIVIQMNDNDFSIFDLWPWALLLGLSVFAFCLLGPFISGLLLLLLIVVITANLVSPH